MSYDKQTQIYNLGVFIVNSMETPINNLKLNVTPVYKTLDYKEEKDLTLSDLIPPKGVVLQTFVGHLSVEQLDDLVQNKPDDITFDINKLQINGEEVKNNDYN